MKNRIALLLTGVIAATVLAGCGNSAPVTEPATTELATTEPAAETTTSNQSLKPPNDATGVIDGDLTGTLEVWSWTTDPEYQIAAFEKAYPNVTVNFTQIGTDYDTKMQTIVDNNTVGPDVFYSDVKNVKMYIEADAWENLSEDPYNADTSDYEDYTVTLGSDADGNVRALSYQATPGGFWYKRDLAQKYLGTDDPGEISKMLSTEEGLLEVAERIKDGSNGATAMFPTYKDIWQYYNYGVRHTAWVDENNNFQMDESVDKFMDIAKIVRDNGYDAKLDPWTDPWYASCADDSVFGFVEPTWGLQYVIMTGAPESKGNWAIASLPGSYFNGGSYLGIYKQSQAKELAWTYIQYVTGNHDYLVQYAHDKGDFTASKSVNAEVTDGFEEPWCAGQNTFEFFTNEMPKIDTSFVTRYDSYFTDILYTSSDLYVNGEKDKAGTIQQFKEDIKSNYRYLNVE